MKRVQYVAANYYNLQGLKFVPIGLFSLVMAAIGSGWPVPPGAIAVGVLAVSLVSLPLIYRFIGDYYRRTFGYVQPLKTLLHFESWVTAVAFVGLLAAIGVELFWSPPVSLMGLALTGAMLAYWWPKRHFAGHYIIMAGVLGVASLLPLFGLPAGSESFGVRQVYFGVIYGAIFIIGGILDHLILVRTLKSAEE